jgi:hypothetical protein
MTHFPRRRSLLVAVAVLLAVLGLALGVLGLRGSAGPPSPAVSAAPAAGSSTPTGTPAVPTIAQGPVQLPASGSPPVALDIPAIGVSGPVNSVGLNPDRTLEVPAPGPLYDQVAWYRGSPTPGRVGPSVILGHVDSAANGPSAFYDLARMQVGNRITVTLADHSVRTFAVDAVRQVPKDDFPRFEVYGDTPGPELRLITCGGAFDSDARSYRDNTVVFARLVT